MEHSAQNDPAELLREVITRSASDLHMNVGYHPTLRIYGKLYPLIDYPTVTALDVNRFFVSFTTKEQQDTFYLNKELDFSIAFDQSRFRANAYYERGNMAVSLRLVPQNIPTIEELSLPSIVHKFSQYHDGLVLITGQTGEGKSTTLASLLNEINMTRNSHIVTIEDPIEFVYPMGKSIISQREVKRDTHAFPNALRAVLRQDPNVIVIGEMRDYETVSTVMTLAETGHLVFSTLHTGTAALTIDRILDVFPEEQQIQVRSQLSSVLRAIISQKLIPKADDSGRIVSCEILLNNSAVSALIREGKTHQIDNVIQTSSEEGMILFEKYLRELALAKRISYENALAYSSRPKLMAELLK